MYFSKTFCSCVWSIILISFYILLSISVEARDVILFLNEDYIQVENGKIYAEGSNMRASLDFLKIEYKIVE